MFKKELTQAVQSDSTRLHCTTIIALKTESQMLVAVITGWQLRKCQLEEDAETESLVKTIPGVCQRGLTGLAKDGMGSY